MNKKNEINRIDSNEKVSRNLNTSNIPEKKIRAGPLSATVWKNKTVKDGEVVEYTTVSFERNYKDKDGNWQTTNSLRMNDLPKAAIVLQRAYESLVLREFTDSSIPEESINI